MNSFKKIVLLTSAAALAVLSGCGKTMINNEADEIKLFEWEYSGEQGLVSSLIFDKDNAVLTVENDSEYCKISGLCVFGKDSFVIVDNDLKKEFLFNYTLTGTELKLNCGGNEIAFEKCGDTY